MQTSYFMKALAFGLSKESQTKLKIEEYTMSDNSNKKQWSSQTGRTAPTGYKTVIRAAKRSKFQFVIIFGRYILNYMVPGTSPQMFLQQFYFKYDT